MDKQIYVQTVKEYRDADTQELLMYLVNDIKWVPISSGNSDYVQCLEWLAEGNTAEVIEG